MSYETSVPPVGVNPQAKAEADYFYNAGYLDNLLVLRADWANRVCDELLNGDVAGARRISYTWSYVDALIGHYEETERLLHRLTDVTPRIEEIDQ